MAVLTSGTPLFVLGFMGMWLFAALDAWRTAQMIRSGVTPDVAENILVRRFSGNPKLWGIVLGVLGVAFLFQRVFNFGALLKGLLPILLIGLGIYLLRGHVFKPRSAEKKWADFDKAPEPNFVTAMTESKFQHREYDSQAGFSDRSRSGAWRDR